MKIKSAKSFRFWYKTKIKEIDRNDHTHNENFVGTYHKENGKKTIKGFFEMYHGDKPNIASYLPSILKIAEDGQAIYEFLQNAVDCGSTHFYIFYNEKYFLAINNGKPFDIEGLQSILNIAQTTKKDPDKIGRFGIGFKLAHRLVGRNEGTDELVKQYKGPILFSWSKLDDLESLLKYETIEPITPQKGLDNGFFDAPYLVKILLTNFPSDPNEKIKDIDYQDQILFKQDELKELTDFLAENFKIHSDSLKKSVLNQGSLFFIKLGDDKKKLLDKDYSELVNGIQYSMNTLKNLQKVYINNEDIGKIPLQLEAGTIVKGSEEFERISPEYKEFDIKFTIGFNIIKFGIEKSYEHIQLLKEKPNFYKYFPMGDEINGFGFIVHCDSFSNEANRRKLHEDEINRNLFPVIAKHITNRLLEYKNNDRNKFLNLYACLLLSDIPDRQNNKWLQPIFYDTLLNSLRKNIPTKSNFSDNSHHVKINKLKLDLDLSDFGLNHIQWFEWDNEEDRALIDEVKKSGKLGIEEWDIRDIIENANLRYLETWISNIDDKTYHEFLYELYESSPRISTLIKLCNVKLFKFSDGELYSLYEITGFIINRFDGNTGNYRYYKSGEIKTDYIFHTFKTNNIDVELRKLGLILCDLEISKYIKKIFDHKSIYYFNDLQSEKSVYNRIADNCKKNTLTPKEKEKLFLNFINEETKFDSVADGTLKDLNLFCNCNSEVKPLCKLIGNIKTPSWLSGYKIKQDEYFPKLDSFLISDTKDIFQDIYQQNQEDIIVELTTVEEIESLVKLYKDNQKYFFKEFIIKKNQDVFIIDKKVNEAYQVQSADKEVRKFINENCKDNLFVLPYEFVEKYKDEDGIVKSDDLHNLILEFVDINEHKEILVDILKYNAKKKFLQELLEFRFNSKIQYSKEDYEYKILELACNDSNDTDIQIFKDKVVIESEDSELKLSEIPPFTDKIKINNYEISLAQILPENYQNSDHLNSLITNFIEQGLKKDRIENLFGIAEEPEPNKIFQMFSEQYELLENAEQLTFLFLYGIYIEKIDFNKFKALNINDEEVSLKYDRYVSCFNFINSSEILHEKYRSITDKLKEFPIKVEENDNLLLLKEPYFEDGKFICPYIKHDLSDLEKLSFFQYLFSQWKIDKIRPFFHNVDWSKIDYTDALKILGFNPVTSVYNSMFACEAEILPDYLIKWVGEDENIISFLADIGIWTDSSVIVDLRKYLSGEINDFKINRLAQESRLIKDEKPLFNAFEWLKQNNIILKTEEHFESLKKIIEVINQNRTRKSNLNFEEEFNFEELKEKSKEWDEKYYEIWKVSSKISIFLYEGELPKNISLDEIEDYVFYRFYEGNSAFDNKNNIYINQNSDIIKELRKLELDNEKLKLDELWQNKLEILEKENERLRKLNEGRLDSVNEDKPEEEFENPFKDISPDEEAFIRSIIRGDFDLNEQLDANTTAKIKTLIAIRDQYNKSEISDEGRFLKAGSDQIIVRSAQNGLLYLDVFHWVRLSETNVRLSVYTNNEIVIFDSQEELINYTKPNNKYGIVRMPKEYDLEDYNSLDNISDKGKWHYIFIVNENTKAAQSYIEVMNLDDYNF